MKTMKMGMMRRVLDCEIRRVGLAEAAVRAEDGGEVEAEKDPLYEIVASSETPVERWFGREILSHAKGAIDTSYLKRNAAFLENHDPHTFLGAVKDFQVGDDRKLRTFIQWSGNAHAQEVRRDVDAGLRTQVSLGYKPMKAKVTKRGDPATGEPDEVTLTRWMPYEISSVTIAADVVGSGVVSRGAATDEQFDVEIEGGDGDVPRGEGSRMKIKNGVAVNEGDGDAAGADAAVATVEQRAAWEENKPPAVVVGATSGGEELNVADEAVRLARAFKVPDDRLSSWLTRKLTLNEIKAEIVDHIKTTGRPMNREASAVELGPADRKRYSYRRAIKTAVDAILTGKGFDGLEGEVHRTMEKNLAEISPDGKYRGGILVPGRLNGEHLDDDELRYRAAWQKQRMTRAYPMDSGTATEGAEGVFTFQGEWIDMLRQRMIAFVLGSRTLPGLKGKVGFPRQTGANAATWFTEEAAAISDTMLATDLVTLIAKTLMATTGWTRQLINQESVGIESIVRNDLIAIMGRAIDAAVFIGAGSGGVPKGIALQSGVGTVDFGAGAGADAQPSWAKICKMLGVLGDAGADNGRVGFATTPLVATSAMAIAKFTNTGFPIWEGDAASGGRIGTYPAAASNAVGKAWLAGAPTGGAEHGFICGNFEESIVGFWDPIEFVVDPYTLKKRGIIELTAFQMVDHVVRHAASFVLGQNVIPTP